MACCTKVPNKSFREGHDIKVQGPSTKCLYIYCCSGEEALRCQKLVYAKLNSISWGLWYSFHFCFFFIWNRQRSLLWNFSVLFSSIHHHLPFLSWLKFQSFPPADGYHKRDRIAVCSLGEIARGFSY